MKDARAAVEVKAKAAVSTVTTALEARAVEATVEAKVQRGDKVATQRIHAAEP